MRKKIKQIMKKKIRPIKDYFHCMPEVLIFPRRRLCPPRSLTQSSNGGHVGGVIAMGGQWATNGQKKTPVFREICNIMALVRNLILIVAQKPQS